MKVRARKKRERHPGSQPLLDDQAWGDSERSRASLARLCWAFESYQQHYTAPSRLHHHDFGKVVQQYVAVRSLISEDSAGGLLATMIRSAGTSRTSSWPSSLFSEPLPGRHADQHRDASNHIIAHPEVLGTLLHVLHVLQHCNSCLNARGPGRQARSRADKLAFVAPTDPSKHGQLCFVFSPLRTHFSAGLE